MSNERIERNIQCNESTQCYPTKSVTDKSYFCINHIIREKQIGKRKMLMFLPLVMNYVSSDDLERQPIIKKKCWCFYH